MKLTDNEIKNLAEYLADLHGAYYKDTKSAFPVSLFICRAKNTALYVDGVFGYTPKNAVAYIGHLLQPPEYPKTLLKKLFLGEFIEDIENAEWEEEAVSTLRNRIK